MSQLIDFYLDEGVDEDGRTLESILEMNDEDMEIEHNFVQWLFPLKEPSQFSADAPLLTDEDILSFKKDKLLQYRIRKSFHRFLIFLGLKYCEDTGVVIKADNFTKRKSEVWLYLNHNWLRITRCLKSLNVLGMAIEYKAFFEFLKNLHEKEGLVTGDTFAYWQRVAE